MATFLCPKCPTVELCKNMKVPGKSRQTFCVWTLKTKNFFSTKQSPLEKNNAISQYNIIFISKRFWIQHRFRYIILPTLSNVQITYATTTNISYNVRIGAYSCGTQHPVGKCFHKLFRVLHGFEVPMLYIYSYFIDASCIFMLICPV